jgi:predicted RNA binding protein YcfA (HicA-like mRNA interferase family)
VVDYGPLLRRVLKEHGWEFLRSGKGDHQIWIDRASGRTVSVDAKSKSRHLSNRILKELGIGKKF